MMVLGTLGPVGNIVKFDGMRWALVLWDATLYGSDPRQPDLSLRRARFFI